MKSVVKFDKQYDVQRLLHDFSIAASSGGEHRHWGEYHDGGWSAIPLVSIDGRTDPKSLQLYKGEFKKTPILKACSYLDEIVDSFACPVRRVRIMKLEAGTNILLHCDPEDSWALGQVRLHIPIVTHDEVYFYVANQRVIMKAGELWYCDFSYPHSVHNKSPIDRMHLVLDLILNPWLKALFPSESMAEQLHNWTYRRRYDIHTRFQGSPLLTMGRKVLKSVRSLRSKGTGSSSPA
jgi:hypothetical protein